MKFLSNIIYSQKPFNSGEIILFLLIYASEDTMLFGTFGSSTYNMIKYVVLVGVLLFMLFKKTNVKKESIVLLGLLTILFVISAFLSGWLKIGFVYNILLLLTAIIFASRYSISLFKESFCRIVVFLSIYSLVIYFLNLSLPSSLSFFPTEYNVVGNEFKNCIFSVTFTSLPFRNFGIFREPGVFMVFLNTALFFEWFSSKSSAQRIFIYILTLLTTVSTAGVVIGAFILAGGAIYRKQAKNVFIALPLVIFAYYIINSEDYIYGALLLDKIADGGSGTAEVRYASIIIPLKISFSSPFGVGPDAFDDLFPKYSAQLYGESYDGSLATATFFKMLAVNGIMVFTFYFWAFLRFVKKAFSNHYLRILFFIVLFLAFGNEDMRVSMLFNIMIAYGIVGNEKRSKSYKIINV